MGLGIQRVYHLPLTSKDAFAAPTAGFLGLLHEQDKTWADIEASLEKARLGEYDTIFFSLASIDSPHFCSAIFTAAQNNHRVVIQWTTAQLLNESFAKILPFQRWLEDRGLDVLWSWIEDTGGALGLEKRILFEERLSQMKSDFAVVLGTRVHAPLKGARFVRDCRAGLKTYFHFPVSTGSQNLSMSPVQVFDCVNELKFHFGSVEVPPGGELFDPRISRSEGFEPRIFPEHWCTVEGSQPEVSVIIPTFNNKVYLQNVLRHLQRQDLPTARFEVIVVDDGSNDGTRETLMAFLADVKNSFNFKFLYFPREQTRLMGDLNFRAGVARNLGVRHADGALLLFLDSDILLPTTYLSELIELHQHYDVVQGARLELRQDRSGASTQYDQVDSAVDTYAVDGGYWLDFLKQPNWNSIHGGWKYTCTHSLSLKKDVFKQVGWFRKVFVGYGFEDSDLGHRLWKSGYKFTVNPKNVFHLYHTNQRSEFGNSHALKLRLLRNTARIFYFNTLDADVFERCRFLFAPTPLSDWWNDLRARRSWAKLSDVEESAMPSELEQSGSELLRVLAHAGKVVATVALTLVAPLEVSFHNPRHQGFWRYFKGADAAAGGSHQLKILSPIVAVVGRTYYLSHNLYCRARGQTWRLGVYYGRVRGQAWRFGWAATILKSKTEKFLWFAGKPLRKIYYALSFQWAEFLKAYHEAEIDSLVHRARKLGANPALEQVQSIAEDATLFAFTFRRFFLAKKRKLLKGSR